MAIPILDTNGQATTVPTTAEVQEMISQSEGGESMDLSNIVVIVTNRMTTDPTPYIGKWVLCLGNTITPSSISPAYAKAYGECAPLVYVDPSDPSLSDVPTYFLGIYLS